MRKKKYRAIRVATNGPPQTYLELSAHTTLRAALKKAEYAFCADADGPDSIRWFGLHQPETGWVYARYRRPPTSDR